MIYLHRYTADGVQIAVVEDARHVERYEARGFVRCTLDEFRHAWWERDMAQLAELPPLLDAFETAPLAGVQPTTQPPAQELTTAGTRPKVTTSMHGWGA